MDTQPNTPENALGGHQQAPATPDGQSVEPDDQNAGEAKRQKPKAVKGVRGFPKTRRPKRIGRPTRLNPKVQRKICALLERGQFFKHACEACDIPYGTASAWYTRGCDEQGTIYHEFALAIEKAKAIGITARMDKIRQIGDQEKNWTAHAWTLERLDPERFHLQRRAHVQHSGTVQHNVDVSYVAPEALPRELLFAVGQALQGAPAIETTAKRIDKD